MKQELHISLPAGDTVVVENFDSFRVVGNGGRIRWRDTKTGLFHEMCGFAWEIVTYPSAGPVAPRVDPTPSAGEEDHSS